MSSFNQFEALEPLESTKEEKILGGSLYTLSLVAETQEVITPAQQKENAAHFKELFAKLLAEKP